MSFNSRKTADSFNSSILVKVVCVFSCIFFFALSNASSGAIATYFNGLAV